MAFYSRTPGSVLAIRNRWWWKTISVYLMAENQKIAVPKWIMKYISIISSTSSIRNIRHFTFVQELEQKHRFIVGFQSDFEFTCLVFAMGRSEIRSGHMYVKFGSQT